MELKVIKISGIVDFMNSSLYKTTYNIPITVQRAISQIHNPRSKESDTALIVAIKNGMQIVGFIGALPEKLSRNNDIKLAWNSCWWVDPVEGKKAAIPLLMKFFSEYDSCVMFRDLTPLTKQIILSLNKFEIVKTLPGIKYFLKFELDRLLINRFNAFSKISILLKAFDRVGNFVLQKTFSLFSHFEKNSFKGDVQFLKTLDEESSNFIDSLNKNELIKRGREEINWIIQFPWVKESNLNELSERYYFTNTSPSFKNYLIKLYSSEKKLIAVLLLSENKGVVKTPYIYFEEKDSKDVASFIKKLLVDIKAISFLTFNESLNKELDKLNPFYFLKKKCKHEFVISNKLKDQVNWNFDFQDGEGDYVFT